MSGFLLKLKFLLLVGSVGLFLLLLLSGCGEEATPSFPTIEPVPSVTPPILTVTPPTSTVPVVTTVVAPTATPVDLFGVDAIAINPAKTRIAVFRSVNNPTFKIEIRELPGGKLLGVLKGHTGSVKVLAFSPDGKTLASGSVDETVRLWNVETFGLKATLPGLENAVETIIFSPDGKWLAASGAAFKVWKLGDNTEVASFKNEQDLTPLAFSPDSRTLAVASVGFYLEFYEVATGKLLVQDKAHFGCEGPGAYSRDGKTFYCYFGVSDNHGVGAVVKWDVLKQKASAVLGHEAFESQDAVAAMSSDAQWLAIIADDSKIAIMETRTGKIAVVLQDGNSTAEVLETTFTADNRGVLALLRDGRIQLWDIEKAKLLTDFNLQKG